MRWDTVGAFAAIILAGLMFFGVAKATMSGDVVVLEKLQDRLPVE